MSVEVIRGLLIWLVPAVILFIFMMVSKPKTKNNTFDNIVFSLIWPMYMVICTYFHTTKK